MSDLGILAVSKNRYFGFEEKEVFRFPSLIRGHAEAGGGGGWTGIIGFGIFIHMVCYMVLGFSTVNKAWVRLPIVNTY